MSLVTPITSLHIADTTHYLATTKSRSCNMQQTPLFSYQGHRVARCNPLFGYDVAEMMVGSDGAAQRPPYTTVKLLNNYSGIIAAAD